MQLRSAISAIIKHPESIDAMSKAELKQLLKLIIESKQKFQFTGELRSIVLPRLSHQLIQEKNFEPRQLCYLIMCLSSFNIYNSKVIKLAESHLPSMQLTIKDELSVYWALIKLKSSNTVLRRNLRQQIRQNIRKTKELRDIVQALKYSIILPNTDIDPTEVGNLLKQLISLGPSCRQIDNKLAVALLIINARLHLLNLSKPLLHDSLPESSSSVYKELIDRCKFQVQIQKSLKKSHTAELQFTADSSVTYKLHEIQGLHTSITEKLIKQVLMKCGFVFDMNIYVGPNQFDFLVKGKKAKPVGILSKKTTASITSATPQSPVQTMEPVLLDIHGPVHYIISDDPCNNGQLNFASCEMRKLWLPHYGFRRYTSLDVREWQKFDLSTVQQNQYIANLVSQAQCIN